MVATHVRSALDMISGISCGHLPNNWFEEAEVLVRRHFAVQATHCLIDDDFVQPWSRPRTRAELADCLSDGIRGGRTVSGLAREFRPELEKLGMLRPSSIDTTAIRAVQRVLRSDVYGVRIPLSELSPRIAMGRGTGGRRVSDTGKRVN